MMASLLDATSMSGPALSATSVSVPAVAAPRNASFGAFVGLRPSSIGSGGVAAAVVSRRTASGFSGRAAALEPQGEGARRFGGGSGARESLARARASSAVAEQAGPTATAPAAAPSKQKIRIKLRSYWVHLIQQACQQILEAAKNTNAKTMGPVPLPTNRRLYCVLRSPHVDKDSREHFEIRTHMRLIDLANPNAQTIDALMQLDLPAGVDVEVKLS